MEEAIKIGFVKEAIPNHIQHKISIFIISYDFSLVYNNVGGALFIIILEYSNELKLKIKRDRYFQSNHEESKF